MPGTAPNEILSFDELITPTIIQNLFWIGLVLIAIGALGTMFQTSFLAGLAGLILGPVFLRVSC
jgi:hypothetical protein